MLRRRKRERRAIARETLVRTSKTGVRGSQKEETLNLANVVEARVELARSRKASIINSKIHRFGTEEVTRKKASKCLKRKSNKN